MKTKSIWEGTAGAGAQFPTLEGTQNADVVIIGGGITGLTAAMLLSNAGKDVVVLEALSIGLGTTGNSTGNLYSTVDEHLSEIKRKWNYDVMNAVVKARAAGLSLIEKTIGTHNIQCDFARQAFHFYAESIDDKIEKFIEEEFDALKEAGLNPQLTGDVGLPFRTVKGLKVEGQAQFQPLRYVRGLAAAISGKCRIFEQSKVIDIDEDEVVVRTMKGSVKAKAIIMATHTPIGVYMIHGVLAPYREFGVAAELKTTNFPGGIFWGMNQPKHSIRVFKDNGKDYIIVVGDKFKTGQHGDSSEYVQGLKKYIRDRLDISGTKYIWGGQHYRTADGLAYIGKHSDKLYFLTGFATDGLVYGTLAAMIVSDQILGKENPWEETFKANRFTPLKSAKDFIVENVDNVVQYFKDMPFTEDDTLRGIQPGQAKVIEKDGEKIGVYKDEAGNNHIVSVVCTHMKCILNWNGSEKSWDCPCHGSRFDVDGGVIEGPAIRDLPHKQ